MVDGIIIEVDVSKFPILVDDNIFGGVGNPAIIARIVEIVARFIKVESEISRDLKEGIEIIVSIREVIERGGVVDLSLNIGKELVYVIGAVLNDAFDKGRDGGCYDVGWRAVDGDCGGCIGDTSTFVKCDIGISVGGLEVEESVEKTHLRDLNTGDSFVGSWKSHAKEGGLWVYITITKARVDGDEGIGGGTICGKGCGTVCI